MPAGTHPVRDEKVRFQFRHRVRRSRSNAQSKCFRFESREQLSKQFLRRLGNHQAARSTFAEHDRVRRAKLADPIQMAEEIEHVRLRPRPSPPVFRTRSPRLPRPSAARDFPFRSAPAPPLLLPVQVHRLDIEGIRRQDRVRDSRRAWLFFFRLQIDSPYFWRNSGDALRTSSQLKKASGVSSQMRNHSAISLFSSRLCGSTLRL